MIIFSLETSCDETACAIGKYEKGVFSILSNVVSSQVKLHSRWGGVVPNLAAREHLKNILPIIEKGLHQAKVAPQEIDLISVTNGPGLIPALLIGTSAAKTLSYLWKKPLLGIHHIEGHIYANFISNKKPLPLPERKVERGREKFPILCLIVSGGHTQLILMEKPLDYKIIGQTLDDAVGEAFDKVAKILNLGYPGGPAIAACAAKIQNSKFQIQNSVKLPRPMINSKDFNFSFSGLKTAVLYLTKKNKKMLSDKKFVNEVCYEFQQAAIDVLIAKTVKAAKNYHPKTILLGGGVSANLELRQQLKKVIKKKFPKIIYRMPNIRYCGDNAAMIATAAFWRWKQKKNQVSFKQKIKNNWKKLETDANLKLK